MTRSDSGLPRSDSDLPRSDSVLRGAAAGGSPRPSLAGWSRKSSACSQAGRARRRLRRARARKLRRSMLRSDVQVRTFKCGPRAGPLSSAAGAQCKLSRSRKQDHAEALAATTGSLLDQVASEVSCSHGRGCSAMAQSKDRGSGKHELPQIDKSILFFMVIRKARNPLMMLNQAS